MKNIRENIALINDVLFGNATAWARLVLAFILAYDAMFFIRNTGQAELITNVMVEVHGLLFDLIILGWIIASYDTKRQKNEQIERDSRLKTERVERDQNLIDDLRGWNNEEGVRKTVGAIRRLNKESVSEIDLSLCILEGANLRAANLKKANLLMADLRKADLRGADLRGAILWNEKVVLELQEAIFSDTINRPDIRDAAMTMLIGTSLFEENPLLAELQGADLREANIWGADLSEAIVSKDWINKLKQWGVVGWQEIYVKYVIIKDEEGLHRLKSLNDRAAEK